MIGNVKRESDNAFGELDMETKAGKGTTPYNIGRSIDANNEKLSGLE
jgi:hypothetical protein